MTVVIIFKIVREGTSLQFTVSLRNQTVCTRNTFYKGQGDFQLVCPLGNLPKLTSFVPFRSLIFFLKYPLILLFLKSYIWAPLCLQLLVP